ncbi:hypothetical protein ABL78_7393 [Leptomonas seymouri]|uniref:Uncharacterized protein n=1 Tax=Leptomonas seymouri TaxID=5684 RepID=A0A0N1PBA2_LEPSE|nr:hypothetical protein ABL78_7393 [Leptomonas seymouri]|eukprot:KPI83570.1 hypothetical protein ABL78_7393 [Leptomonas seymouri]
MENPFAGLRPEMRSEHDEIRKGIFSRALRNMQSAPLNERREWCKAIRATYTAAQAAKQKRAAATASSSAAFIPPPSSSLSSSSAVGMKRTHSEAELSALTSASSTTAAPPLTVGATSEQAQGGPSPKAAAGGDAVEVQEREAVEEGEAAVKECIAAYLRSLLDRVVGVSLENLNVPALRILCSMVGIKTEVRNKIALYSTLASFYYTECEKLGKRVSRDTIFERQVEQEAAMLRHVSQASPSSSKKNGDKKASAHASVAGQDPISPSIVRSSSSGSANKPSPAAVVVSVTSKRAEDSTTVKVKKAVSSATTAASTLAKPRQSAKTTKADEGTDVQHYLKYESIGEEFEDEPAESSSVNACYQKQKYHHDNNAYHDGQEGEVVYESRVFSRPGGSTVVSSAHMAKYTSSTDEGEWSMPMLERKVASIVQLHDPVTLAIVVRKLSQLGYHDPNAEDLVERILRRFHDRQLIYYDNGIAYLM